MEENKQHTSSQNITKFIVAACIVVVIVLIIFSSTRSKNNNPQRNPGSATILPTVPLEEMTMQIEPTQIDPSASTTTVHISLNTANFPITGAQFGLRYNPSALAIQSVQPTNLIPNHQVLFNINDSKAGVLTFGEFIVPNSEPAKGNGPVADVVFTVKNPQGNLSIYLVPSKTILTSPGLTLRPTSGSDTDNITTVSLSTRFTTIK